MLLLARAGLRRGEAAGLRRSDVHLLADSRLLGCEVPRAHLHVVRREDNPNGAWAKSRRQRVVPLDFLTVQAFDTYQLERAAAAAAADSDFALSRRPDKTYCPEPGVIWILCLECASGQPLFAGEVRIISSLYRIVIN